MLAPSPESIKFFKTPAAFRKWLEKYHDKKDELYVGYYKKATALPSITWPQSVDEALCYGWIDSIRRKLDEKSYCIRFTPRRKGSHWSTVNIARMKVLLKDAKVQPTGLAKYRERNPENTAKATHEQKNVALHPALEAQLKKHPKSWEFFKSKSPSYRKQCTWWIMSAKRKETQIKRLNILMECSSAGKVIPPLKWTEKKR